MYGFRNDGSLDMRKRSYLDGSLTPSVETDRESYRKHELGNGHVNQTYRV